MNQLESGLNFIKKKRLLIKLDANGEAAYDEWSYNDTPNWSYTGGGKWIVKDNVLTLTAPNGSVAYSSFFTLSSDGKTITFVGDTTEGHFSTLKGEFTKQQEGGMGLST